MNVSVSMVHVSPAAWLSPVYVPSSSTVFVVDRLVMAVCVALGGCVAVEYPAAAASKPAAAGYLASNRRLALLIAARVKRGSVRREILQTVEEVGAAGVVLALVSPGGLSLGKKLAWGA
jgi:hypothetical protein